MISVSNVSMRYGAKILFDEVSTGFTPGKRYGLTGPNGSGKTTFMKLLAGELDPQKGNVVRPRKLSVLGQDQFLQVALRPLRAEPHRRAIRNAAGIHRNGAPCGQRHALGAARPGAQV